jgi:hypothetical protein
MADPVPVRRHNQFDDNILSRSLRTHGATFGTDSEFQDFRREHLYFLRVVIHGFLKLLEGAPPPDALVNITYRKFQHTSV